MNNRSFLGKTSVLTLILVGFGWAVYAIAAPTPQTRIQQQDGGFSYAQLFIQGEDQVSFDIGGKELPRIRSLAATYRELGGNGRATEINLLNVIGKAGWELVQVGDNVWTFKRRN